MTIRDLYAIQTLVSALDKYDLETTLVINQPLQLHGGKFVIFRLPCHGSKWNRQVYVDYDFDYNDVILVLHYYTEFQAEEDVDLEMSLHLRALLPEYTDAIGRFTAAARPVSDTAVHNLSEVYPEQWNSLQPILTFMAAAFLSRSRTRRQPKCCNLTVPQQRLRMVKNPRFSRKSRAVCFLVDLGT